MGTSEVRQRTSSNGSARDLGSPTASLRAGQHGKHLIRLLMAGLLAVLLVITVRPGPYEIALASYPVIAAAGDIACDPAAPKFNGGLGTTVCRQQYTSDLLVNQGLAAVLPLGDNQYGCGGYQAYLQSYALSWGRLLSISRPVVGNHEYMTSGGTDCSTNASGYFQYFGSSAGAQGQGYYSFDIGTWHIIALNSNCEKIGGCGKLSAQYNWLKNDLATHPSLCTLAYFHHPLFSSGGLTNTYVRPLWKLLYGHHADVVLNGHAHIYERFAPQTPAGVRDPRGIREFIVGTGGSNHTAITSIAANSKVRNATTFGILRLALHSGSYTWKFVPQSGQSFTDSGTAYCH